MTPANCFSSLQLGQYRDSLEELKNALDLSAQLKDHSHDADILGEMADAYADMGNFEEAAKVSYVLKLTTRWSSRLIQFDRPSFAKLRISTPV